MNNKSASIIEMWLLRFFLENPNKKYHLRELARLAKVSPATLSKKLPHLVKEGLITEKMDRIVKLYQANFESSLFKAYKVFYTIQKIIRSGLLTSLDEELNYPNVILFGSASKGEDIENSDLDVFILSETKKSVNTGKFEKILGKNIQIFLMNREEFEKAKKDSKELMNNMLNGIRLSGSVEVL